MNTYLSGIFITFSERPDFVLKGSPILKTAGLLSSSENTTLIAAF